MGRELGRISGPLLADNLKRNGSNLAFDTKVLYLDVVNNRVGFNTSTPVNDLYAPTAIDTTRLIVDNTTDIGNFAINGSTIQHVLSSITISPSQTLNPTIVVPGLSTSSLYISANTIVSTTNNSDINFITSGTGQVVINSNTLVNGSVHATGSVTFDGNITFGNASTDTVTFNADVSSGIIPLTTNTYNLGSSSLKWKTTYLDTANIASGLTLSGDTSTATFTASGTNALNGNTTIGTTSADNLTVNASLISNIVPSATNTYNLGGSSYVWKNLYIKSLTDSNLTFTSYTVSATTTNSTIVLNANGTGKVVFSNLNLTHNASFGSLNVTNTTTFNNNISTGAITQTGDFNQTGNTGITGNITSIGGNISSGTVNFSNFSISNQTITTTNTNGDATYTANGTGSVYLEAIKVTNNNIQSTGVDPNLLLTPQSTGSVIVNNTKSIVLPIGTNSNRTLSSNGEIRYNSTYNNIEGYESSGYVNFFNLYSQDQKTYATGELTPNAADNTLRFAVNNVVTTTVTSSKMTNNVLLAGNIYVTNNTIYNSNNSTNITLTPSGTGNIKFNGTAWVTSNNNFYVPNNGALTFNSTANGYLKFAGTNGLVIPIGDNSNRPSTPQTATTRWNTQLGYGEVFNGTAWTPIGGSSVVLSQDQVTDTMYAWDLILG